VMADTADYFFDPKAASSQIPQFVPNI